MTTPRTATLAALGVAGIAAAALATGSLLVGSAPASVDGTAQSAHPSQVQLACPTALVVVPLVHSDHARAGLNHGYRRRHPDGPDACRPGWR